MSNDTTNDGLAGIDVVFVPATIAADVLTDPDPVALMRAEAVVNDPPPQPSQFAKKPRVPLRFRCFVLSTADTTVERIRLDVPHGYQTSEPVIPGTGGAQRSPSTDPAKGGAGGGTATFDWLDAAPPGSAAAGVWVFEQHAGFPVPFRGVTMVLVLQLSGVNAELTVGADVDAYNDNPSCGLWLTGPGGAPDTATVTAAIDAKPLTTALVGDNNITAQARVVSNSAGLTVTDVFVVIQPVAPPTTVGPGGPIVGPGPQQDPDDPGGTP